MASAILARRRSWRATTLYKILEEAVLQSATEDGDSASAWTMRRAFDALLDVLGSGDDTLLMLAADEAEEVCAESSARRRRRQEFQTTADAQQKIGAQDGEMVRSR